jgi:hypothetical protein
VVEKAEGFPAELKTRPTQALDSVFLTRLVEDLHLLHVGDFARLENVWCWC